MNSPSYTSGKQVFSSVQGYINSSRPISIVEYNNSSKGRHAFVLYGWNNEYSNLIAVRNPWYSCGTSVDYNSGLDNLYSENGALKKGVGISDFFIHQCNILAAFLPAKDGVSVGVKSLGPLVYFDQITSKPNEYCGHYAKNRTGVTVTEITILENVSNVEEVMLITYSTLGYRFIVKLHTPVSSMTIDLRVYDFKATKKQTKNKNSNQSNIKQNGTVASPKPVQAIF